MVGLRRERGRWCDEDQLDASSALERREMP
jgi:hypothetical protein